MDKPTRDAIYAKKKTHRSWMNGKKGCEADNAKAKYTWARNKVKTLLRKAKRRFERGIAMLEKSNSKSFWGHIRRHLKTKRGVAPLLLDTKNKDSMKFDDEEKANVLLK